MVLCVCFANPAFSFLPGSERSDKHQLEPPLGCRPASVARVPPRDLPQVERHLDGRTGAARLILVLI